MRVLKFIFVFNVIFSVLAVTLVLGAYFIMPRLQQNVAILVLGKGGEGHTAPNLTDTIMTVYLNNDSKTTSLLSLPRDIWIPEIRAKLNTAYHYGGFKMAGDSVTSITGLPISYTAVIDFTLFKDLIDSIGGINVDVENSFVDDKYPITGLENDLCDGDKSYKCRYETLSISKGMQEMNGELALKFVRSRNSVNDEGTDVAREKRQQKVIFAVKEKLLSKDILLSPQKVKNLYNVFVTHIETDIDKKTATSLAKFLFESRSNINFLSIPENLLVVSQNDKKYDNQYIFIPKDGNWLELQRWIRNNF